MVVCLRWGPRDITDIKRNTFFSQLINLWKKDPITKHIQQFQKFSLRVKNNPEYNLLDLLMGTLKENIQREVCLLEPKPLEHVFIMARKVESKNMANVSSSFVSWPMSLFSIRSNKISSDNHCVAFIP